MRFIWHPQAQVMDSDSGRIARRGKLDGSGARLGSCLCWRAAIWRHGPLNLTGNGNGNGLQILMQRCIEQALLLGAATLRVRGELTLPPKSGVLSPC
jgi:hypothetical protein